MDILRIGTDCSGIEAPIQALLEMNIPFTHVFSSDIVFRVLKQIIILKLYLEIKMVLFQKVI